jgi:hypothetical protein
VVHRELAIASAVMPAVAAACVRAEDEAAEEDDSDDEDDACDDADPGGDGGDPRAAPVTLDMGLFALDVGRMRRFGGGRYGARCWFV